MNRLFDIQIKTLIITLIVFLLPNAILLQAQSLVTVKGQVTDEMGPLPGVTVLVKGNPTGGRYDYRP